MQLSGRRIACLLFLPPAAALAMGALMLQLALESNPGVVAAAAPPLSKTSWREGKALKHPVDGATVRVEPLGDLADSGIVTTEGSNP